MSPGPKKQQQEEASWSRLIKTKGARRSGTSHSRSQNVWVPVQKGGGQHGP